MLLQRSANNDANVSTDTSPQKGGERTWLEDERAGDLDVAAVARGLDAAVRADERADDERGRLANAVERAELHPHGGETWRLRLAAETWDLRFELRA